MANLFIDTKQLKTVSIELGKLPKQVPGAMASALNRTLNFTATQTVREVREEYAIKAGDVRKTIKKRKASKSNMYAYIQSTGNTISLVHFPHRPHQRSKRIKTVQVRIKKAGGYKAVNTTPKAFVQTMNNATLIWKREGRNRFPVKVLRTLSVPQMIGNDEIMKRIQKAANQKLQERISHEINWRLEKAARRTRK